MLQRCRLMPERVLVLSFVFTLYLHHYSCIIRMRCILPTFPKSPKPTKHYASFILFTIGAISKNCTPHVNVLNKVYYTDIVRFLSVVFPCSLRSLSRLTLLPLEKRSTMEVAMFLKIEKTCLLDLLMGTYVKRATPDMLKMSHTIATYVVST